MTTGSVPVVAPRRWWHDAVVYQIYPRSFADSNGDGVGDLRGIVDHLDHIESLGVDAVWLSPIFVSPMRDFGYDVADYVAVDPVFGTEADLDDLIDGLHQRGMRLLLDWVPNHSSDQHPWFVESRRSRTSPKRNWYVWRDPAPDGGPPNNWNSAFHGAPAWTFDETTQQYYLHLFLPEQPDLNWAEPELEAAMHDTLRHWLDRGVDGFRADVVHLIGKDPELPDLPDLRSGHPNLPVFQMAHPSTHDLLRRIRTVLDGYAHDPMMVGEVYLLRSGQTVAYLGDDDELHLTFDFRAIHAEWEAATLRRVIAEVQSEFATPRWPTWVLSNHDRPRQRTRYGGEPAARAAAVLTLTMRATPFLYAGEELGLEDATIPPDRVVDPAGRDGCRAPIPWTPDAPHGWGDDAWLPFPPRAAEVCAAAQQEDPGSMLSLYRRLLELRRDHDVLRAGSFELLDPDGTEYPNLVMFRRGMGRGAMTVAVNVSDHPTSVSLTGELVLSSAPGRSGAGKPFDGSLAGGEAVILAA